MKVYDKKDVYCIMNAQDAKQYLDKKGYFSDYLHEDLYFWAKGALTAVEDPTRCGYPFCINNRSSYALFLPDDKVKDIPDEKKYRPFTPQEFLKKFKLGTVITYRCKDSDDTEFKSLFSSYQWTYNIGGANFLIITLGSDKSRLDQLLEKFEYYDNDLGLWAPFGVEKK